jgi:hypothetical protein
MVFLLVIGIPALRHFLYPVFKENAIFFLVYSMKVHGGVELKLHSFVTRRTWRLVLSFIPHPF